MGTIINLNRERKRRSRAEAEAKAAENRAKHGRTAPEKARDAEARRRSDTTLDTHRLDNDPSEPGERP